MVSNRMVIVTISENRVPISVIHADGFTKYFPNIYFSVHSLIKAFNLSSWVILHNIKFFSFNFYYHVLGLLTIFALLSQLPLSFF